MAHFARIADGVVAQVIVVNDDDAPGEAEGQAFIASIGLDGNWVQTSYSGSIRGKYAGIGDAFDGVTFTSPLEPESASVAYARGKADGATEALSASKLDPLA